MNPRALLTSLFLLTGLLNAREQDQPQSPSTQFSEILEAFFTEMKETTYQHKTEIDEKSGVWKCDCSGLIGHILRQNFPEAYLHVDGPSLPGRIRPLSVNYCETFIRAGKKEGQNHPWKQITQVKDLQPGDILAWKNTKIVKGKSTGHTLMIAGLPKLDKNDFYRIRIIDSTTAPHANDTRTKKSNGVGAGEIWLSADKDGKLKGYKNNAQKSLVTKNTIAVGRLRKITGPATPLLLEDHDYLQLDTEAARLLAKKRDLKSRVISEDLKTHSVTRKIEKKRINFVIVKGKVTRVIRG
ncbi:MAG: hypothetical protein QNL77_13215 [Akkermansiaceae bacterium]